MEKKFIHNCTGGKKTSKMEDLSNASQFIFRLLLIIFLGVFIYIFFFSGHLQITQIEITGNNELKTDEIKGLLYSGLEGKYLGLMPRNNFLLFSCNSSEMFLKDKFKKIRKVNIEKRFPDTVQVSLEERKALLVFCGQECFLIDEEGTAYNTAVFDSQEVLQNNLLRVNDISSRKYSIGEKVMDEKFQRYSLELKNALKDIGITLSNDPYETPSNVSEEIDVRMEKGTKLLFSTQYPLESAVQTLSVIIKKEIDKENLEKVEYIDLRSEGKVFYKLKGEENSNSSDNEQEKND